MRKIPVSSNCSIVLFDNAGIAIYDDLNNLEVIEQQLTFNDDFNSGHLRT